MRTLRPVLAASALSLLALLLAAGAAGAQTTTTIPELPVTGGETTTDTEGDTATDDDLATTGLAADSLGMLGVILTGSGLTLELAARRTGRRLEPRVRYR